MTSPIIAEVTTARTIRAFGIHGGARRFAVCEDSTVLALDDVAGCFTSVHSLSARQQARIRAAA